MKDIVCSDPLQSYYRFICIYVNTAYGVVVRVVLLSYVNCCSISAMCEFTYDFAILICLHMYYMCHTRGSIEFGVVSL